MYYLSIQKLRGVACLMVLVQHLCSTHPNFIVMRMVPWFLHKAKFGCHIFLAIAGYMIMHQILVKLEELANKNHNQPQSSKLSSWLLVVFIVLKNIKRTMPIAILHFILYVCGLIICGRDLIHWIDTSVLVHGRNSLLGTMIYSRFLSLIFGFLNFYITDSALYFGLVCFWWMCAYWQLIVLWSVICAEIGYDIIRLRRVALILFAGFSILKYYYAIDIDIYNHSFYYHTFSCADVFFAGVLIRLFKNFSPNVINNHSTGMMLENSLPDAKVVVETNNSSRNRYQNIFALFLIGIIWTIDSLFAFTHMDNINWNYMPYLIVSICATGLTCMAVSNNDLLGHGIIGKIFLAIGMRSYQIYALIVPVWMIIKAFMHRYLNIAVIPSTMLNPYHRYQDVYMHVWEFVIMVVVSVLLVEIVYRATKKNHHLS